MERLTYKLGGQYGLENKASAKAGLFTDYDGFYAYLVAVNKLGEYEDTGITPERCAELAKAEQEGRLVELPCKVGDKIFSHCWSIKNERYEICAGEIKNVRYDSVDRFIYVSDGLRYYVWGKTVFLTHQEAEKALEREGGNATN